METQKLPLIEALTCNEKDSIKEIASKLKEKKDRRIFVVDSEGKLKGIITTTDITYKGFDSNDLKAKDIMVADIKAINSQDSLEDALEIMNELQTFICPVINEGKLLGSISYHEVINYLFKNQENKE